MAFSIGTRTVEIPTLGVELEYQVIDGQTLRNVNLSDVHISNTRYGIKLNGGNVPGNAIETVQISNVVGSGMTTAPSTST